MKKIISALTLGAMVAGAAFADVSINLNFRQRANLFTKYDSDTKYAFNPDAYSGSGSDNLAMSLSGDIVSFDMQWVSDAAATAKWRAKGINASVFLGPVTVFGGLWADGKLNGAYRTKPDIDAGNLEGMDFEYVKLGSAYKTAPDNFFDNMMGDVSGNLENFGLGVSYKVPGIDNGALTLNATYLSNENSKNNGFAEPTTFAGHTGVFLADGRIDGIGQGELSFKYGDWTKGKIDGKTKQAMSFGVALQPTLVKNLINTFVFTGSMIDGNFNDYAVNLRLRYQAIPKKLSITSFHNYSAIVDADKMGTERKGMTNETAKGLADSKVATDMKLGGATIKADAVMSNNLMVRYNVNDTLSVYGIVADMMAMTDESAGVSADANKVTQLRCSAWTQFYADKNNSVAVGFVYAIHDLSDNTATGKYTTMGVPVIFRVKM